MKQSKRVTSMDDMLDDDLEKMSILEVKKEVMKLRIGIRNHRDLKGNNRCHLDDKTLYLLLPEKAIVDTSLPPKNRFLENCEMFHPRKIKGIAWKA
jgi:hypothetical protein